MQSRQLNRRQYFNELATTSEKYFIPYIKRYRQVGKGTKVLEIGCGDGGNLLPFSRMGCDVVGVDMAKGRKEAFPRERSKRAFHRLRCVPVEGTQASVRPDCLP